MNTTIVPNSTSLELTTTLPANVPPTATPNFKPKPGRISAPSSILMGPPGSGKTYSVSTLLEAGLEVFCILTEPNALDSLLDALERKKLPIDKLHWCEILPQGQDWSAITQLTKDINNLSYEGLTNIKGGIGKANTGTIIKLLQAFQNFPCERTGMSYGDVTLWREDRALVIDSLSGLNALAMQNTVGFKPAPSPGEWGVAMNLEEQILNKLTSSCSCFLTVLAHVDRNADEVSGAMITTPSAIGSKLGPKIGRFFSEVVLTRRDGSNFYWSTQDSRADTKARALAISNTLSPSFIPLVETHKRRLAALK